jgi:hypothetical protein
LKVGKVSEKLLNIYRVKVYNFLPAQWREGELDVPVNELLRSPYSKLDFSAFSVKIWCKFSKMVIY